MLRARPAPCAGAAASLFVSLVHRREEGGSEKRSSQTGPGAGLAQHLPDDLDRELPAAQCAPRTRSLVLVQTQLRGHRRFSRGPPALSGGT